MVNVSAYPVQVDGRRLDDLAIGLEASSLTLGGLRSADQVLAGLDGEVASTTDSREPGAFALSCLVKGTDKDGLVPAGADAQATYQRNLETLKHLLCKTGTLLDVKRVTDKANSAILGTGGRTNLVTNPTWRLGGNQVEVRRNLTDNPTGRAVSGTTEVRRNYCLDPNAATPSAWATYVGVSSITADAAAAYSGSSGLLVTTDGTQVVPRIQPTVSIACTPGEVWTISVKLRLGTGAWAGTTTPSLIIRGPKTGGGEWSFASTAGTAIGGGWYQMTLTATIDAASNGTFITNFGFQQNNGVAPPAGATFHVDEILYEKAGVALPWFSGGTVASDGLTYSYVGTPNNSESIATGASLLTWAASGGARLWRGADGKSIRVLNNGLAGFASLYNYTGIPVAAADMVMLSMTVASDGGTGRGYVKHLYYNGGPGATPQTADTLFPVGGTRMSIFGTIPSDGTNLMRQALYLTTPGAYYTIRDVLTENAEVLLPYFDGATAPTPDGLSYGWSGTPDRLPAVATGAAYGAGAPFYAYNQPGLVGWTGPGGTYLVLAKRGLPTGSILLYQGSPPYAPITVGAYRTGRVKVRQVASGAPAVGNVGLLMRLLNYTPAGAYLGVLSNGPNPATVAPDGSTTEVVMDQGPVAATADGTTRFIAYASGAIVGGTLLEFREGIQEDGTLSRPYFDGNSAQSGWSGAADASNSIQDSADVRASAKVVDSITPEDSPGGYGRLTAVLKIVHAYWRGVTWLNWVRQSLTSGQAMEVTSLEGSSAPIGDAVYCLTGPANSGVQIQDVATGTFVRLNEALPAGSVWRVNADTWESRVAAGLTVDSPDTAGVDKAGVTDQSGTYPRFLRLHPRDDGTGRRVVKVSVVGTGFTSATSLTIKARGAHL